MDSVLIKKNMERTDSLVAKLIASLKTYFKLQREYALLELTEKLTRVLTALILGSILFVIAIITVIFLALTCVSFLTWLTGSEILAYGIVTVLFVALALLLYFMRNRLLVRPLTQFFTTLLLTDDDDDRKE